MHQFNFLKVISSRVANVVVAQPLFVKVVILVVLDGLLCVFSSWFAFYIRLGDFPKIVALVDTSIISIMLALPIFFWCQLYRVVFRHFGSHAVKLIFRAVVAYSLIFIFIFGALGIDGVPRTISVLQPLILFTSVVGARVVVKFWLIKSTALALDSKVHIALIYGAGSAGRQLAAALAEDEDFRVVGFLDDDISIYGRVIEGLKVYSRKDLSDLVVGHDITHIFLAIPSLSKSKRNELISALSAYRVVVRVLPTLHSLASGRLTVNDFKDLEPDDLLYRAAIEPDPALLRKKITEKVVLVTGAGGSIGSELSRQIFNLAPEALVLLEFSEYALYEIHSELERRLVDGNMSVATTKLVPLLCSIQDSDHLLQIFLATKPDTVFHAAAFKHVPLVENNVSAAFNNNVFGTLNVAEACIEAAVSDMVMVSTDKAVRPTNVMGATKRMAELVVQALQAEHFGATCFSMVRFGNVLASSGSVIPKFQQQIREGSPITVTHPEVTRFFMTIPEAAQLVIQACALSRGGDLFILDMGKPVKIVDLARKMIALCGMSEITEDNPNGDVKVVYTGLRPGEKLYEELLIDKGSECTEHPSIMRANEKYMPWADLTSHLIEAKRAVKMNEVDTLTRILKRLVEGFDQTR